MTLVPEEAVRRVLAQVDAVLVDFDGPICQVFAGVPAPEVAADLRRFYAAAYGDAAAAALEQGDDPVGLVQSAGAQRLPHASELERRLSEHETAAMRSAAPTAGAAEALAGLERAGFPLAAVSNNSGEALRRYFEDHGLEHLIKTLIGRPSDCLWRMKPDPYPLEQAARTLGVPAHRTVLIGDSITDVQAAQAAGALSIGFANKPGKSARLSRAGADAVITSMAQILAAVDGEHPRPTR